MLKDASQSSVEAKTASFMGVCPGTWWKLPAWVITSGVAGPRTYAAHFGPWRSTQHPSSFLTPHKATLGWEFPQMEAQPHLM